MPQFQPDYLISWDFSDPNFPCVGIVMLEKDKANTHIVGKIIGDSHEKTGVISLRQAIEYRDFIDREEEKRKKEMPEHLKKFMSQKEGANDEKI